MENDKEWRVEKRTVGQLYMRKKNDHNGTSA
jgi:hypothetical protein